MENILPAVEYFSHVAKYEVILIGMWFTRHFLAEKDKVYILFAFRSRAKKCIENY